MTNLQPLFNEPIRKQHLFEELHPGHASYVWLVETDQEEVVVRTSRMSEEPAFDFWWGCLDLFGTQPTDVFQLQPLNALVGSLSAIPVPQVLRRAMLDGQPYVVVQRMQGKPVLRFSDLTDASLEQLGQSVARIHARRFDVCGTPFGQLQYPVHEFHLRLVGTLKGLVERYYTDDQDIVNDLHRMCSLAGNLPAPMDASLIMIDMDPTQFLADESGNLTALIDTEVYALGPSALDFISLEYTMDDRCAAAFARGYAKVLDLPNLEQIRPLYRYLYRLLAVQGHVEYRQWMDWPIRFP